MAVTIRVRRGTTQQWENSTRVLLTGELGLDTTLNKLKAGNGVDTWNNLPYLFVSPSEITELVQDAIGDALPLVGDQNVLVTYDDENNIFNFTTGPNVVLFSDLGNSLGDYVPLADVGNPDGVAPLDENSLIPDEYIPDSIARDSEIPSLDGYATETYVNTAISNLVDAAPETLDTLNELAAALGDDANYATTITNALATKLNIDTASLTYLPLLTAQSDYATKTEVGNKVDNNLPSVDYYVTNDGSGAYIVNGVSNGRIDFQKGKRYRIFVYAPGHPFWIQTVSGGYSEENVYSTGITNAGTQNGSIIVELPQNAPDNLYYACQFHPSMAGSIYVQPNPWETFASKDYVNRISYGTAYGSSSYTVDPNDIGFMKEFTGNSDITVTIPDDPTDSDFPIGSVIEYRQMGSGRIEFVATSPAILNSTDGYTKTRTQYSGVMLEKRGNNSWLLVGDIDA